MYSFLVNKIQCCLLYSSTLYSLLTGSDISFNQALAFYNTRCLVGLIYAGWLCWLLQNVVVDLKRCPHISRSVKLQNLQNKIPHTTLGQCLVSGFYSKFLMWHSTILSFLLICWPLKYSVREVLMAKNWALRQILTLNLTRQCSIISVAWIVLFMVLGLWWAWFIRRTGCLHLPLLCSSGIQLLFCDQFKI